MGFFSYMLGKSHGGGNAGGGSGGGSSDYDGLICYDVNKVIERMEETPIGSAVKVSDTVPDLTGKSCILANKANENYSAVGNAGEVTVIDEETEDGTPVKFYMCAYTDGMPICLVLPKETAQLMGMSAGVWVTSAFSGIPESYIIFK